MPDGGDAARLPPMSSAKADDFAAIIADPATPQAEKDLAGALWAADRALDMLTECHAERERLRVIVDLACAEHEVWSRRAQSGRAKDMNAAWRATDALHDAVAAEVARRAAL